MGYRRVSGPRFQARLQAEKYPLDLRRPMADVDEGGNRYDY